MSTQTRCHCQSCTIRSLMGPAIVITVGVLFLLHQTQGGRFFFGNTFPIILLVIGAIQLASAFASREGHIDRTVSGAFPPAPAAPPTPPFIPPTSVPPVSVPPSSGTPPSGSEQSPYSAQGQ